MASLPANIVIVWSGAIVDIPDGWFLCNGTNGTPDLRNRFSVGSGSKYLLDEGGGTKDAVNVSHTHSVSNTNTDGNHLHSVTGVTGRQDNFGPTPGPRYFEAAYGAAESTAPLSLSTNGNHSHSVVIGTTGESGTNKNMPPYYALAYIMKGAE